MQSFCIGVERSPYLNIAYELKQTVKEVHQYKNIMSSEEGFYFL